MDYRTACGGSVTVSRAAASHMRAHPVSRAHLEEAIAKVTLPGNGATLASVDLGRIVGTSGRVDAPEAGDGSTILAAVRMGRKEPSQVVLDVEPEPTPYVALVIRTAGGRSFLTTAYYGTLALPEPHDPRLRGDGVRQALAFWFRQALVWTETGFAGPPFETTWDRILSGKWKKDARTPYEPGQGFTP